MNEEQRVTPKEVFLKEKMTNEEIKDLLLLMINVVLEENEKKLHTSDN
jgi:hypothetical protein